MSEDLVPASVLQLIAVFEEHEELKFPGVTAETLSQRGQELESQALEVERLEQQLGEAKELLFAQKQQLLLQARQAHAYATIFAEGAQEEEGAALKEQLAALQFEPEQKVGRKRKPLPKSPSQSVTPESEVSAGEAAPAGEAPGEQRPTSVEPEEGEQAQAELTTPGSSPESKRGKQRSAGTRASRTGEALALER